jgi:hypothetical protein
MMFHISDEEVQTAFAVLHEGEHAKRRAAYEYAERRLKSVLAEQQKASEEKTVAGRETDALTTDVYADALKAFRQIAESYYAARDKRDAAAAVIEAWRTQQSDRRAMGRVA